MTAQLSVKEEELSRLGVVVAHLEGEVGERNRRIE
jgi:hypothetical protein